MDIIQQLKEIKKIQGNYTSEIIGEFNSPITDKQIMQIERLIEESLPDEFKQLYLFANGQCNNGNGILLGEKFIDSDEIIRQIEFSKSLIKPELKTIENPELSESLMNRIISFYLNKAPKHKLFKKSWFKIEFSCGVGSYGGPYLYINENTTQEERDIIEINYKDYKNIKDIINQLHELEKQSYNWDELEFEVFSNGKYNVERKFFDFDNEINFTSNPENSIKRKYFHYKWLPIFSDYGGNYLGIDLDPGISGKRGQIINFGRDESDMFVLADNLNKFFELIINEINKPNSKLVNLKTHLHDVLKELIIG